MMTEETRDAASARSTSAANSLANWIKLLLGSFGLAFIWLIIWGAKLDSTVNDTKASLSRLSAKTEELNDRVTYLTTAFCLVQGWSECPRLRLTNNQSTP